MRTACEAEDGGNARKAGGVASRETGAVEIAAAAAGRGSVNVLIEGGVENEGDAVLEAATMGKTGKTTAGGAYAARKAVVADKEGWMIVPGDAEAAVAVEEATEAGRHELESDENAGGGKAAVDKDADEMSAGRPPEEGENARESVAKGTKGSEVDGRG